MKRLVHSRPGRLLLLPLLLLLACTRQDVQPTDYYLVYADYRPLLLSRPTFEGAVAALPPQAMHNTGKIYLLGNYVFINEKYQGIHVIDNRDPANPRPVSFLRIPGNADMAVRGTVLYADSGPDLVTLDLSNPAAAKPLGRVRNAFQELPMPVAGTLEEAYQPTNRPADAVVVGWRKLAVGEAVPLKITYNRSGWSPYLYTTSTTAYSTAPSSSGSATTGKAGSLARFAILGQTLYTVDTQSLHLFDLQNPAQPVAGAVAQVGFDIETIFPRDHYLFLGSQTGMFIYDVATPAAPKWVSTVRHARSCDPVVVEGNYAYVTLRSAFGTTTATPGSVLTPGPCGSTQTNEVNVVDLTSLTQPKLVRTYALTRPQGLGASTNRLYICDDVLRVFDLSKTPELTQVQQFSATLTDVIPNGDYLLGVGPGGLYQYFVGGAAIRQVSLLAITPTE